MDVRRGVEKPFINTSLRLRTARATACFNFGDWIRKPGVAICSCNDGGLRPVIFKLEATGEDSPPQLYARALKAGPFTPQCHCPLEAGKETICALPKKQTQAIRARGSNLLLSAAAGSGKTAVLVERVLSPD